ncbi:MAG: S26 family signal peptidase, partial [Gemmatimonadales bacterium]
MSKSKPGKPQGKKSEKDEKEVQAKQNVLVNWMKSLGPPVAIFLLIRAMLLGTFKIPSGSMENTLLIGDFLFANKALYGAE